MANAMIVAVDQYKAKRQSRFDPMWTNTGLIARGAKLLAEDGGNIHGTGIRDRGGRKE